MAQRSDETEPTFHEIDRWDGGFGWMAYPDEFMERASHALATDEGVWVLDPVDAPGLDDRLADIGPVAGVAVLVDRHRRDAATIARRFGVPVTLVGPLRRIESRIDAPVEVSEDGLPGTDYRAITVHDRSMWSEIALCNPADGTLVVSESLGTAAYFRTAEEPIGVHPMLSMTPPRTLEGVAPDRILVGHGTGVMADATMALDRALSGARRRIPRLLERWVKMTVDRYTDGSVTAR